MNTIKTSNDRLRIAPEEIIAVEVPLPATGEDVNGFVHLSTAIKLEATAAELEEIAVQWDEFLENREDDDPDDEEVDAPGFIDVAPERPGVALQRRRAFRNE